MKQSSKSPKKNTKKNPSKDSNTQLVQIKTIYYSIWSVVGLVILILVSVAVFGADSWSENLNLSSSSPQDVQPAQTQQSPQPQQPPQPTQEQLDCVADAVGEERFAELEQGAPAEGDETATIQACLQ
jgi:hypothetical protein